MRAYLQEELAALGSVDCAERNDRMTQLFSACDAQGYVHLTKDGSPYITACSGEQLLLSEVAPDYVSRVPKKAFEQMIELSETYVENREKMVYGNYHTAFNAETTNEIDCSSFAELIIDGVPYEGSRYAHAEGANKPKYHFGLTLPDNPYSDEFGPRRYLANQLAHYAFDHDFAFYPNENADNVQPGDIVFFSTNKKNVGYFMDITHVAVCVERQEDDLICVVHGNNRDTANYYRIHLFTPLTIFNTPNAYINSLVLVARYPFATDV